MVVQFRHTGDAPILKQSKFKVPAGAKFSVVSQLLRQHLRLEPEETLVRRTHMAIIGIARCNRNRLVFPATTAAARAHPHTVPIYSPPVDSSSTAVAPSRRHPTSSLATWQLASRPMACLRSTTA